jgi:hypothetical protein
LTELLVKNSVLFRFCVLDKYNFIKDMFTASRPVLGATQPPMGSGAHFPMGKMAKP